MSTIQSNANEFVFRRKRKRPRVDFEDTKVGLEQASDVGLPPGLVRPEVAVLAEPPTSSPAISDDSQAKSLSLGPCSESLVTVENVLRRSIQMAPNAKLALSSAVSREKHRAYTRHRSSARRTTPNRKVVNTPEQPRMTRALFRAAVLTGGDPIDTLVDGAGISHTRRPLKFVPINKFADSLGLGRGPTDPANAGNGGHVTPHTRLGDSLGLHSRHYYSSRSHRRTPLRLVPFREAEAAYSTIFS